MFIINSYTCLLFICPLWSLLHYYCCTQSLDILSHPAKKGISTFSQWNNIIGHFPFHLRQHNNMNRVKKIGTIFEWFWFELAYLEQSMLSEMGKLRVMLHIWGRSWILEGTNGGVIPLTMTSMHQQMVLGPIP